MELSLVVQPCRNVDEGVMAKTALKHPQLKVNGSHVPFKFGVEEFTAVRTAASVSEVNHHWFV